MSIAKILNGRFGKKKENIKHSTVTFQFQVYF